MRSALAFIMRDIGGGEVERLRWRQRNSRYAWDLPSLTESLGGKLPLFGGGPEC